MEKKYKPAGYWDKKENCLNESKKYETKTKWKYGSPGSFFAAKKHNWIAECCEHMEKPFRWTKEKCIEEAKKYSSKSEWEKKSSGSIYVARKNGWYKECILHKKTINSKWTKELCIQEAKKYKTKCQWKKKSSGSHRVAKKNGWIAECCEHMEKPFRWTKELCTKEAKKHKSKSEWQKKSYHSYYVARLNKWMEECTEHMIPPFIWTKDICIKEAKKYNSRTEWQKKSKGSYNIATKNKWLDECCIHMTPVGNRHKRMVYCYIFSDKTVYVGLTDNEERRKNEHLYGVGQFNGKTRKKFSPVNNYAVKNNLEPKYVKISDYISAIEAQKLEEKTINEYKKNGFKILNRAKAGSLGGNIRHWTKEKCIEEAKKYRTKSEWSKKSGGSYSSARINGWFKECIKHMPKHSTKWTKETCIEDAKKYMTRNEWGICSRGAYEVARTNKWLDECCGHMIKKYTLKKPKQIKWSKETCIEDAKKYTIKSEWAKKSSGAYNASLKNNWVKECSKHMVSPWILKKEKKCLVS